MKYDIIADSPENDVRALAARRPGILGSKSSRVVEVLVHDRGVLVTVPSVRAEGS